MFNMSMVMKDAPRLFLIRRTWVNDAILKLSTALGNLGPAQQSANINLELPKEVWIIDKPYTVHIDQNQLESLKIEKELLDKITM